MPDATPMTGSPATTAHLPDRSVLKVAGPDARHFLDGLFSNDLDLVSTEVAGYGALLTPQGKVIVDFFIIELPDEDGGGFLIDMARAMLPDLARRLMLYKLRAKIVVEDLTDTAAVIASINGGAVDADGGIVFTDPRHAGMGQRAIIDAADVATLAGAAEDGYHAHRIGLGMPAGGGDFGYGGQLCFPHEALMDQLGGVSFSKGCYVGQEVVSRMQHRGTARTRIVPIVFLDGLRAEEGSPVTVGERIIGNVLSTANGRGLAMLRLDKVADAMAAGEPLLGGGLPIRLDKPAFISFHFPGEPGFGGAAAAEPAMP
jgi:tRNA-modifying protein YgfZ